MNMETNIGKTFLKLVKKQFSRNNSFHKIFNRNTIKVSYSFMRNISSIIASHSIPILRQKPKECGCNCRNKESCPLQNQCVTLKVIYEATAVNNSDDEKRVYFGASYTTFKERYCNHMRDLNHERYSKRTDLSKYICHLKRTKKISVNEWKLLEKCFAMQKSITVYCV